MKLIRQLLAIFVFCVFCILPLNSYAEINVMDGFEATVFATGFEIPSGLEFAPTGDLLFVSDIGASPTALGKISTINPSGIVTDFVTKLAGIAYPEGLVFGPGGDFGTDLYFIDSFTTTGSARDIIFRADASGNIQEFLNLGTDGSNDLSFGIGNEFGNDLYVASFGLGILRINSSRDISFFSRAVPYNIAVKFGPGGDFGTDLYVGGYHGGIYKMNGGGQAELFVAGIVPVTDGLAFSQNNIFGNFLYATDYNTGEILRIDPYGTATVFASGFQFRPPQAAVRFGAVALDSVGTFNGDLFVAESGTGRIIRISTSNKPPVANAGADQNIELQSCSGLTATTVTLDGSGSSDPDGDMLNYAWAWPGGNAEGNKPIIALPYGTTVVTLTVDDGKGGISTDTVSISVVDTAVPTLSIAVTPNILWPPNHKYVRVFPIANVGDACVDATRLDLVSVTSNEPDNGLGDGDTSNDVVINNDGSILLRAERSGRGNGRIYTITYKVSDAAGNSTVASAIVTVPHNK